MTDRTATDEERLAAILDMICEREPSMNRPALKEQLLAWRQESVLAMLPELEYRKLEKCPACGSEYMYRCTCPEGADWITAKLTAALTKGRKN